jgi:arylsulfate sulfotransferase
VNNVILGDGTPGNGGTLREVDLTGATVRELDVATMKARITTAGFDPAIFEGPHHDVILLPNGHFLVFGHYTKPYTDLPGLPGTTNVAVDSIIDLDASWNVTWVWDGAAHLDIARAPMGYPDWTHCNGLLYSPVDHDLIVSCRNQSLVFKLDYNDGAGSGSVIWRLGNGGDFSLTNGTVADWNYGQHNPNFFGPAANDVLAVWDNGNNRVMDSLNNICGTGVQPACYSRGVAFHLDEIGHTATIVFDHRPGIFAPFIGSIQLLANGNVEDDAGAIGFVPIANINEVTNAAPPQPVWHMQVNGSFVYRGTRIPSLYPGVQW